MTAIIGILMMMVAMMGFILVRAFNHIDELEKDKTKLIKELERTKLAKQILKG